MVEEYPEYVKKDKIDICNKKIGKFEFRTTLKIPLTNKSEKKMTIIMMNPSKANKNQSDITVNRILKYANKKNSYKEVTILNVISLSESSSNKINQVRDEFIKKYCKEKFEKLMEENFKKIESTVNNADSNTDIYLATGNPLPHESRKYIEKIYNDILVNKEVTLFKSIRKDRKDAFQTVKKYSYHPSRQPDGFLSKENSYKTIIISFKRRGEINIIKDQSQ